MRRDALNLYTKMQQRRRRSIDMRTLTGMGGTVVNGERCLLETWRRVGYSVSMPDAKDKIHEEQSNKAH